MRLFGGNKLLVEAVAKRAWDFNPVHDYIEKPQFASDKPFTWHCAQAVHGSQSAGPFLNFPRILLPLARM